jgi:glutamine synthetase
METMQKVALRNGLVCLLYEKPFAGVNGSGKHNNWSMATDDGQNLLEPGHTPHDNEQFLVVPGRRHQGGGRATPTSSAPAPLPPRQRPPSGRQRGSRRRSSRSSWARSSPLSSTTSPRQEDRIQAGQQFLTIWAWTPCPSCRSDNTDRNRTSPFAFTGNKFEFRMVPSSMSIADANTIINTIVAEALDEIADRLEKAKDLDKEVNAVVREAAQKHSRVIFNGNGYSEDWVTEAAKRGLPNIKSAIEALKALANDNAVALFEKYKVLSGRELHSRYEIGLEQYAKHINIEARCAIAMTKNEYIPAVIEYTRFLAETVNQVKAAGGEPKVQAALLGDVSALLASASKKLAALESALDRANAAEDLEKKAAAFRDSVFTAQVELRKDIDALEVLLPRDLWPVPTYQDMLFNI